MFTGLIQTTGTVLAQRKTSGAVRMMIASPQLTGRWSVGDSIAVNGVCLTAVDMDAIDEPHPSRFAADLAEETVRRTTLTQLSPGSLVNLELPTPAGAPLGGHVVQGHVDGTGTLIALTPNYANNPDHTDWRMTVEVPLNLAGNIIPQGSITIDGISLTVARMDGRNIEIAVIPHTYRSTNLHSLLSGMQVNLETDVLSKYAARNAELATQSERLSGKSWLTASYLLANGY